MSKNFITPNWLAINKAIDSGSIAELRAEQTALNRKIQEKITAKFQADRNKVQEEKITTLKALPIGATVYYTGRSSDIRFGAEGYKQKDGRTRMSVKMIDGRIWGIYYINLKCDTVTTDEITSNKVETRIINLISNS